MVKKAMKAKAEISAAPAAGAVTKKSPALSPKVAPVPSPKAAPADKKIKKKKQGDGKVASPKEVPTVVPEVASAADRKRKQDAASSPKLEAKKQKTDGAPAPTPTAPKKEPLSVTMPYGPLTVFVGGVVRTATVDSLRAFFASCGKITDVFIPTSGVGKNKPKGFGFVTFANEAAVKKALEKHESTFESKQISVKMSQKQEPQDPEARKKNKSEKRREKKQALKDAQGKQSVDNKKDRLEPKKDNTLKKGKDSKAKADDAVAKPAKGKKQQKQNKKKAAASESADDDDDE